MSREKEDPHIYVHICMHVYTYMDVHVYIYIHKYIYIARMSRQRVSIGKINSSILKFFKKHHSDFKNVCQSKQELLNLIS